MFAGLIALSAKAGLSLIGSMLTEKLFMKILARVAHSLLEWMVESTKTTVDNEAVAPVLIKLKEHF